jgi:quinohemoprotein ethanol dehydrogenase
LTTAGNLVFQGTADGRFIAYSADNGEKLWENPTGSGVLAAPVTYLVDDKQYVSIMAGWGGAYGVNVGFPGALGPRTLLTFALEGKQELPEPTELARRPPVGPLEVRVSTETLDEGRWLYHHWCDRCHGGGAVSGGIISDLRYSEPEIFEMYSDIVLEGALQELGMPSYEKWLTKGDVEAIRGYVQTRAAELASTR